MQNTDNPIEHLIYLFSKLPGLGQRSARRIVLHLLEDKKHRMDLLSSALSSAVLNVSECEKCNNLDIITPCAICSSENRQTKVLAIVESVADLWAIERSNNFKGLYHVLGFNLSATNNRTPETLGLHKLKLRCEQMNIEEIIIATNSTLEGQTTAFYITEFFNDIDVKVTRLASGIPIGGELDYLDEGTLTAALNLRQPF